MNNIIERIASGMLSIDRGNPNEPCPISIIDINKWEWAQGVGMYGLYRYYEISGDKTYSDYLKNWYDMRIKEGLPSKNVNTCAPLLTFTFICEDRADYFSLITEWADWLMNELPRTPEMGFPHYGSGSTPETGVTDQLWDDTIFMCVLFLARAGIVLQRKDLLEETKRQFLVHLRYLTDLKTGLMFHAWNFKDKSHFGETLWGRGNCWITVAIPDYIDIMGEHLEPALKSYLIEVLHTQIKALKEYQAPSGMWHTLIDDPDTYEESSATAGFGYGIHKSIRLGYVSTEYSECAKKALEAIVARTDAQGLVQEVSYGTTCSYNRDYYKNIKQCPMTYGQALAILCIAEGMR